MLKRTQIGAFFLASLLLAVTSTSQAQLLYSQNFETDDSPNWVVLTDTAGATHQADFNFDYSTMGIPPAPHSTDHSTHGLRLAVNVNPATQLGSAVTVGESASPTNFSISQNFDMHVDMWANYNGPNVGPGGANVTKGGSATNAYTTTNGYTSATGGSGSTILWGCGYGTLATSAQYAGHADSVFVGVTGDDGTASQIRMYSPSVQSSFQDGVYQKSGTTTPDPSGDFFVYNNSTGTRNFRQISNTSAPGWTNHFWATPPPASQVLAWRQQTNIVSRPGTTGFAWHDVEVQKIGNIIVYSIDGFIAGTANSQSAGTPAGTYLTFLGSDINGNASLDPNYTNLNFVVFDNIVVSNYANIVQATATQSPASEAGTPGVFTITRTSAGVPLTVNYTMSGTATNGANYHTLSGSVTFNNTDTATNITLTPIDDGVPEATMTAVLSITPSSSYVGAGSATINILDNDMPTIDIASKSQAYEEYSTDHIDYTVSRRGRLTGDLTVNLSYGGTAVSGTDFTPTPSVVMPDGMLTTNFQVFPLHNPAYTGNRTVIASVAPGSGYASGGSTATGTVVDAEYPAPVSVLFADDLSSASDAANWNITYGTGDPTNNASNFNVDFGYSLSSASIAPPPNAAANALHVTCNKLVSPGAPGAVNVYYTGASFSGNYAVRFSMNIIQGDTFSSDTEGAVFGIDHSGSYSNWIYGSGTLAPFTWSSDGIWYFVTSQGNQNANGDFQELTGQGSTNNNTGWTRLADSMASAYTNIFKYGMNGPFSAQAPTSAGDLGIPGTPANGPPIGGYSTTSWVDVEIKQSGNIVTMSLNHTPMFVYTNTTPWTSGKLMLGYSDPYGASIGSADAGVYYSGLQVVRLPDSAPPVITVTSIAISGGNVVLKFTTTSAADTTASFTLQSSATVNGTYGNVSPAATVTSLGGLQYQATVPYSGGGVKFYRLSHN